MKFLIFAMLALLLGVTTACENTTADELPHAQFYAEVLPNHWSIENVPADSDFHTTSLLLNILPNQIFGSGAVTLTTVVDGDSILTNQNGEPISPETLPEGSIVSVTFDGLIAQTYPGQIFGATSVQLITKGE